MQSLLAAVLATVVLAGPVGFWLGDGMASGRYEKRLAAISEAITESQNAAIDRSNTAIAAASKRATEAERRRAQQRALSAEVNREIAQDTDLSCEWRPAHRLRIEALYGSFGYSVEPPSGVRGSVLPSTKPEPPQ